MSSGTRPSAGVTACDNDPEIKKRRTIADYVKARDEVTKNLTSHSSRSGSAQTADCHPDVHTSFIIPRGGWTPDAVQTVFNYVTGNAKTDTIVARALSGWPTATSGGICPSYDCLPKEEQQLFRTYARALMGTADISDDMKCILTCVLLLRDKDVRKYFPDHQLVRELELKRDLLGISQATFNGWVVYVRKAFVDKNLPQLPLDQLEEPGGQDNTNTTVQSSGPVASLTSTLKTIVDLAKTTQGMIEGLKDEVESIGSRLSHLEAQFADLKGKF
jgi:hypothetical protein